jgi:hypothetical protein
MKKLVVEQQTFRVLMQHKKNHIALFRKPQMWPEVD